MRNTRSSPLTTEDLWLLALAVGSAAVVLVAWLGDADQHDDETA